MTRGLPHRPDESSQNGARPPPLLPVSGATKPYWRSQLHDLDEYRSTAELPSECDIAIIGAGMSGVATAYNLLQLSGDKPKPSIVLLEARQICSGATGRNGVCSTLLVVFMGFDQTSFQRLRLCLDAKHA